MSSNKCSVCRLIAGNAEAKRIVHDEKLAFNLTLVTVIERVQEAVGVKLGKAALVNHYRNHLSPSDALVYRYLAGQNRKRSLSRKEWVGPAAGKSMSIETVGDFIEVVKTKVPFMGAQLSDLKVGTIDENNPADLLVAIRALRKVLDAYNDYLASQEFVEETISRFGNAFSNARVNMLQLCEKTFRIKGEPIRQVDKELQAVIAKGLAEARQDLKEHLQRDILPT